jgi:hypothetical protein
MNSCASRPSGRRIAHWDFRHDGRCCLLLHTRPGNITQRIGLTAAIGYLDLVLLPALAIFLTITRYALWSRKNPE